jgi:hypothetical protein
MEKQEDKKLRRAIAETKDFLNLNYDPTDDDDGYTDDDAIDHLMDECGQDGDGNCSMAGTEYCDWDCPFS